MTTTYRIRTTDCRQPYEPNGDFATRAEADAALANLIETCGNEYTGHTVEECSEEE